MRGVWVGAVPAAALVVGMLTGCSADEDSATATGDKPGGQITADGAKEAGKSTEKGTGKGRSVGAADSPCPLPVSFDLEKAWEPSAMENDDLFGAETQGTVTLVCEIDAKPAGHLGFIRVWTGDSGDDARKALEAFVADWAKNRDKVEYSEIKAGALAATEVTFLNTSKSFDEPKKERALAVTTPGGVVVVHLGGLDSEEHDGMLPAYELAKKSMRKV